MISASYPTFPSCVALMSLSFASDVLSVEGDMGGGGGPEHRNTEEKFNEHRITARKVHETPSP